MDSKLIEQSVMNGYQKFGNVLDQAQFIKKVSTDIGFDTNDSVAKAFDKIQEELKEVEDEVITYLDNKARNLIDLQKETGDLLFAVCGLANKINIKAKDCLEVKIKLISKDDNREDLTILDKAQFLQEKKKDIGFCQKDNARNAFQKIKEEFDMAMMEIQYKHEKKKSDNTAKIHTAIGNLLFSVCGLANTVKSRADVCLEMTIDKFVFRNCYVETKLKEAGKDFSTGDMRDMCRWWNEAKKKQPPALYSSSLVL